MLPLLLFTAEPFSWEERSFLVTTGPPIDNAPVIWVVRPSIREVARLYPKGYVGNGYAHISCTKLRQNGSLENCRAHSSRYTAPHPFAANPDFDIMALKVVKRLRTSRGYAKRTAGNMRHIGIVFRFSLGSHNNAYGFCVPFCSPHFGH